MKVASADTRISQQAIGRGEFGHDQSASPKILDEAAEDGVGDSGHGRQHGRRRDTNVADAERLRKRARRCGDRQWTDGRLARPTYGCNRVVPELLHTLILRSYGLKK